MDRPSYRLEHALSFVFAASGGAREWVNNLLHGTWLGHPLHPALTAVPIGAVSTTVALDAATALPGRRPGLREASRAALGVGILGSLGAAATGLTDWQHTQERPRRVGLVHGVANVLATSLYATSWWQRRRGHHALGVVASALGCALTISSGYLGAVLVYRWGTGVDRSGGRLGTDAWTPVLPVSALDGQTRRVKVDGIGLVLYRNGKDVVAVGERCPHLGAPMSDGWLDRGRIVCPWHGSRFEPASGEVLRGPATAPLPRYPTRVRGGMIELRGCAGELAAPGNGATP